MVLTIVSDPPQATGVKAVPRASEKELQRTVCIVAGRATERASAGRSVPIRTNPDPKRLVEEANKARTTLRNQKNPISEME